jgi:hypothetical protein
MSLLFMDPFLFQVVCLNQTIIFLQPLCYIDFFFFLKNMKLPSMKFHEHKTFTSLSIQL